MTECLPGTDGFRTGDKVIAAWKDHSLTSGVHGDFFQPPYTPSYDDAYGNPKFVFLNLYKPAIS